MSGVGVLFHPQVVTCQMCCMLYLQTNECVKIVPRLYSFLQPASLLRLSAPYPLRFISIWTLSTFFLYLRHSLPALNPPQTFGSSSPQPGLVISSWQVKLSNSLPRIILVFASPYTSTNLCSPFSADRLSTPLTPWDCVVFVIVNKTTAPHPNMSVCSAPPILCHNNFRDLVTAGWLSDAPLVTKMSLISVTILKVHAEEGDWQQSSTPGHLSTIDLDRV